jgi:hypothetical protein
MRTLAAAAAVIAAMPAWAQNAVPFPVQNRTSIWGGP